MNKTKTDNATTVRTLRWLLATLAQGSFIWAGLLALNSQRFLQNSDLVEGVLLSSRIESVAEDNVYIPLVEYTTLAGQTLRGEPSGVQFTNERAPGSRLILRYAREEPRLFRLENRFALWGSAGFLAFIGLVFLAVLWLLRPKRI